MYVYHTCVISIHTYIHGHVNEQFNHPLWASLQIQSYPCQFNFDFKKNRAHVLKLGIQKNWTADNVAGMIAI